MRELLSNILNKGVADTRERILRLILLVGLAVSLAALVAGMALDDPLLNAIPILVLLTVILVSMVATFRYHKVDFAAIFFAVFVIGAIFPFVFFSSGGIESGATVWFVLGLLYIFIMFRGKRLVFFIAMTIIIDLCTYVVAYQHPQWIVPLKSKSAIYYDSVFAVIAVGIAVGLIMRYQLEAYERERERTLAQKSEIEKISKSKDAFFTNMSHEIRTPINTIIGLNEMILREDISEEVEEDALRVQNASKILLALINNILDFSQIESERMAIVPVAYYTKELFDDVISLLQTRMDEKNLDFHIHIDSELPSQLLGDEVRIKQVLINLLTNAAKYTHKGYVAFSVQGELISKGVERLKLTVTDTGIGIKKEDLESLYDYFKRIDRERNRRIEGSGLGLAITKQLVNLMGGTITVDSIYQKGSVFTVTLDQPIVNEKPIGDANYLRKLQSRDRVHYKHSFEAPMAKILVADDNETNLMVISKLLRATKVQIDTARNGKECLEMAKKKIYHVILLDSLMPGMDGLETLKAIRRQESSRISQTPIIAVTAEATPADKKKYLENGFDGYLAKPIDGNLMEAEILKFLPEGVIEYRIDEEGYSEKDSPVTLRRHKKKIQISTDCVSDVPKEYMEQYDIKMVYTYIKTDDGIFQDTIEIDSNNFSRYRSNPNKSALAVSAPMEEYETFYAEALTEAEELIHISLASGAGDSYSVAAQAAQGFDHVHVIDSGFLSCGEGLLVLAAVHLLHNGCNQVEELCRELELVKKHIFNMFFMPDVRSYYASGHGSRMLAAFCGVFDLYPIVCLRNSSMAVVGLNHGSLDKARKSFIRRMLRRKSRIDTRIVFITHAGCTVKQQQEIVDEVLKYIPFEKVIMQRASVSGSSNGGLGTIGIAYLTKVDGKNYSKI